jgi:hypothetical protein
MVYAEDLKSLTSNGLWVRVPLPALRHPKPEHASGFVDGFAGSGTRRPEPGTRTAVRAARRGRGSFRATARKLSVTESQH